MRGGSDADLLSFFDNVGVRLVQPITKLGSTMRSNRSIKPVEIKAWNLMHWPANRLRMQSKHRSAVHVLCGWPEQADFITQPRRHSSFDATANTYVQSGPFKNLDLLVNTAWHPRIQPCVSRRRLWVKSDRRPLNTERCQSTYESLNFRKI